MSQPCFFNPYKPYTSWLVLLMYIWSFIYVRYNTIHNTTIKSLAFHAFNFNFLNYDTYSKTLPIILILWYFFRVKRGQGTSRPLRYLLTVRPLRNLLEYQTLHRDQKFQPHIWFLCHLNLNLIFDKIRINWIKAVHHC